MDSYRYLIVGGGMAADAVCKGIRSVDETGTIGVVGAEAYAPYKRPPLTKDLWTGGDEEKIWRKTAEKGAQLHLGRRVVSIDTAAKRVRDDAGDEYGYEKLVLATGGTPRRLGGDDDAVIYFRDLDDYRQSRGLSDQGASFAVIGGGFIGSEMAAALRTVGRDVTVVLPEAGIGWRNFPPELSAHVTEDYRRRGVTVLTEALVDKVAAAGSQTVVTLKDGGSLTVDAVVAGLGIVPNVELAESAGLTVDDGIVVDEHGRVDGAEDVFATGDVVRFPYQALGKHARVEHEDHANTHGRVVGANAAGAGEVYDHLPFFYSDLFEFGYEAVGEADTRLRSIEAWRADPFGKGGLAFLDESDRPRGILTWGIFGKMDAARELIRAGQPLTVDGLRDLVG